MDRRPIIEPMSARQPTPEEIEQAFARARQMQTELARREPAVGRKIQTLAAPSPRSWSPVSTSIGLEALGRQQRLGDDGEPISSPLSAIPMS